MDRLLELLREVERNDTIPDNEDVRLDGQYKTIGNAPRICTKEIQHLATELFITDDGDPRFELIDQFFKEHGYFIFPGERDRFGWVTACLQTKKGFIVFG